MERDLKHAALTRAQGLPFVSSWAFVMGLVTSFSLVVVDVSGSEQEEALAALSESVSKAESCASVVKQNPVGDCAENADSSVESLTKSVKELGLVGKDSSPMHLSNVQTWVSTALTDLDTCLEGLDGPKVDGKLKGAVTPKVLEASQAIKKALALVNAFASKQKTPMS
ncbi:hypothetical protein Fmac_025989 [Flemingia macrophylla]|uniref:Pectinesterase inhibitor domain-containing protein n=1 Tax=Flemingia macrophylla TaxID=520843 RepID=A0ABD1LDL3_9FABA